MAELFRVPNYPGLNLQDDTSITQDVNAGEDTVSVLGTDGFQQNDAALVGSVGALTGEIHLVDVKTPTSLQFVDNLILNHRRNEPITKLFGDQIRMYRAADNNGYPPSVDSFSLRSTTSIDADSPTTIITDSSGSSSYWYKFSYYNSVTQNETSLTSSISIRGGGYNNLCSVDDIIKEAGLQNNNQVQDTQVATRRDQAQSEVKGSLMAAGYVLPLRDSQGNFYTPPMVENIVRLLAAGYVLNQDYGAVSPASTKDGDAKIKTAQDLLAKIQSHELLLVDIADNPMATRERVRGLPDDMTATVGTNGTPEPRLFTINKKF